MGGKDKAVPYGAGEALVSRSATPVSEWVVKQEAGSFESWALDKLVVYFRDEIILKEDVYPWDLEFAHSLKAIASWRVFADAERLKDASSLPASVLKMRRDPSWLYDFVCAFFCHGFGGTVVRDLSMAETPSLYKSRTLLSSWALAFMLVYASPFDVVFRLISTRRTVSSLMITAFEAIDSSTTIAGSVQKGRSLFPDSPTAPFVAGIVAGIGGSLFRYFERRLGRGWADEETEWARPTLTLRRTIFYTVVYMSMSRMYGRSNARLWLATFHVAWELAKEITGFELDFTENFL